MTDYDSNGIPPRHQKTNNNTILGEEFFDTDPHLADIANSEKTKTPLKPSEKVENIPFQLFLSPRF